MVSSIEQVRYGEQVVIQQYVDRPLLLNGYKFDLRIYVLVTSFQPLEAFVYEDGFARFSTQPYTVDASSLSNLFIHLTNSSIQKHNPQQHKCTLLQREQQKQRQAAAGGG